MLNALGELNLLRTWVLELDTACLAKLKEIAMRTEIRFRDFRANRPVASLVEAQHCDSEAAWFLAGHKLKTRERARLEAILEAEKEKADADRNLEKLTATHA